MRINNYPYDLFIKESGRIKIAKDGNSIRRDGNLGREES